MSLKIYLILYNDLLDERLLVREQGSGTRHILQEKSKMSVVYLFLILNIITQIEKYAYNYKLA